MKFKICFLMLCLGFSFTVKAQENDKKNKKQALVYAAEAEEAMANNEFAKAEASYRKAIAKDPDNAALKYNLGSVYYNKNKTPESERRLKESATSSESKTLRHRAFHNQGNALMKQKKYEKAVEAYKNALRNDPTDEQTRYNLALAKEKLEKKSQEQDKKQDDGKDQQESKDQQQEQDKKEDQNKKGDQNKEGDQGKDQENKGEQNKQEKKEGEGDQEKQQPQEQKDKGEQGDQQQQQQPQSAKGKMSPQQIKNLLEAMENQEKEIQDKINAQRAKGQRKQTDKDW